MPRPTTHTTHKKRHGNHQKRTPHFLKVYQPFLPLMMALFVVGLVLSFSSLRPNKHQVTTQSTPSVPAVLSYATSLSSNGLLSATNARREAANVGDLTINAKLTAAAQAKANDMATKNYWAHNTPDGTPPWTFITNAGYSYNKAGENLACGFEDNSGVITGWYNSPSHRENLLHPDYKEVGFGIANSENYNCGDIAAGPQTIVVAMYGAPYSTVPKATTSSTPKTQVKNATTAKPTSVAAPVKSSSGTPMSSSLEAGHTVIVNVTDASGKPAKNIKATIHSVVQTTYTDSSGQAKFTDVEPGKHTVTVEIDGAKTESTLIVDNSAQDFKIAVKKPELTSNTTAQYDTGSPVIAQPKSLHRLDLLTGEWSPWILAALLALSLIGGFYVLAKHSLAAHKFMVKGERYILKHKLVDVLVVLLFIGLYFVTRNVAAIL